MDPDAAVVASELVPDEASAPAGVDDIVPGDEGTVLDDIDSGPVDDTPDVYSDLGADLDDPAAGGLDGLDQDGDARPRSRAVLYRHDMGVRMNDDELIERCRAGDTAAFGELVGAYRTRTWAVCSRSPEIGTTPRMHCRMH